MTLGSASLSTIAACASLIGSTYYFTGIFTRSTLSGVTSVHVPLARTDRALLLRQQTGGWVEHSGQRLRCNGPVHR